MIKVKIYELEKHRNETTFRPYLEQRDILRDIGLEITEGDSYDFAWIGQASIADKLLPLEESVSKGLQFMYSIGGDSMIFDGQDSHSLIGVYEVFRRLQFHSGGRCLLLLKNTLLRDFGMYKSPTWNGRWYWGKGNYSIPDIDDISDRIVLSGTNWLSTAKLSFYPMNAFTKTHDVAALFGNALTKGTEHGIEHYVHYNNHRDQCLQQLDSFIGLKINSLRNGERVLPDEYYQRMASSKIVIAPFGYGEMAPRDLETMAFGSILIKPTMSHLISEPWIYDEGKTYIGCRYDFLDLSDKIDYILSNYESLRKEMYEYAAKKYLEQYNDPTRLATHLHKLFTEKLTDLIAYENS